MAFPIIPPQGLTPSRARGPVINAQEYGARDTNTGLDSTTAIQNALTAAKTAQLNLGAPGGSTVYLPRGKYLISSPLVWPSGVDGVVLEGDGIGATEIFLASGSNTDMVQFSTQGSLQYFNGLRDISLNGQKASNTAGSGIHVSDTNWSDLRFERVFVLQCKVTGYLFDAATPNWSPRFTNCLSEFNGARGIDMIPNNVAIIGGMYAYNGTDGILLTGGASRKIAHLAAVTVYQNVGQGIWLNCAQASVGTCHVENAPGATGNLINCDGPNLEVRGNVLVGTVGTVNAVAATVNASVVDISHNDVTGTFTAAKISINSAATNIRVADNPGYNPVGILATPFDNVNNLIGVTGNSGTLTSAKVYTCLGPSLDIYWTAGTVSAQTKNGTAIPQSAAATNFVHLEPTDTYSITFTVTPTTFDVFGL